MTNSGAASEGPGGEDLGREGPGGDSSGSSVHPTGNVESGARTVPPHIRRSSRKRGTELARRSAGVAAGVVLLGACGALVAGSLVAGPDGAAAQFAVPTADVPAGEYSGVCPEQPRLLETGAALADPEFSPESETAVTTVSATVLSNLGGALPGSALTPLGGPEPLATVATATPGEDPPAEPSVSNEDGLTNRTAGVVQEQAVDTATVLSAQAVGAQSAAAAGVVSYSANDGDLRGLTVANCSTPANDFWILGGSTTLGATSVLNLSNPSQTPATVNLDLHGAAGPVEAGGTRDLLIPPGATESIVLAGLATNEEQLAVRVRSDGARVTGSIAQSVLRGLTPGGVELLQPSAPAAGTQVMTGVRMQDPKIAGPIREQDGYEQAAPSVQVVVPGGTDAVLNVRVYGSGGEVELPDGGVVTAAAGTVSTIGLQTLAEGDYTVEVSSDVLISASAKVSRGTAVEEPVDFGFAPSGVRLGNQHVAVFPGGASTSLIFGAPAGRSEIQLTPVHVDGTLLQEQVVSVGEGTTVALPAADLGEDVVAVLIGASGDPVYGAQVHTSDGDSPGISVTAVEPGTGGRQSVAVNLGY